MNIIENVNFIRANVYNVMHDNTIYIQGQETSGTDHISSKDGTWYVSKETGKENEGST